MYFVMTCLEVCGKGERGKVSSLSYGTFTCLVFSAVSFLTSQLFLSLLGLSLHVHIFGSFFNSVIGGNILHFPHNSHCTHLMSSSSVWAVVLVDEVAFGRPSRAFLGSISRVVSYVVLVLRGPLGLLS